MQYQLFLLIIFKFCLCASLNPPATGDAYANLTARLNELEQKVTTLNNALEQKVTALTNHTQVYFTAKLFGNLHGLGTNQVIHFENIRTQEGHGYDTVTGIFTAPISGTYLFIANMINNPTDSPYLETFITKDGVRVVAAPCNNSDHFATCSATLVIRLAIGDRVWIEHSKGGTVDNASYFSGVLINTD